jgi:hypothetical protein
MRGYKAGRPVAEHFGIVATLVLLGLAAHEHCPAMLAGFPVTHWASVPSLPTKPGEHPLHKIINSAGLGAEARLVAADGVQHPRDLDPAHFSVPERLPEGSHILLVDDTWTKGGHAQSAALALRLAGAARVSLLVAARWIKADFGDNASFLREIANRDYDPGMCPWTGGACPGYGSAAALPSDWR